MKHVLRLLEEERAAETEEIEETEEETGEDLAGNQSRVLTGSKRAQERSLAGALARPSRDLPTVKPSRLSV
jgi:hypothetical protein